ncbi:class I SAM-dependent rRNA methyltransferase [Terribacillus saccharophilus]|uniref:RlmI/RlmK family 23S rRNA methyltransferase n=1 Tax=Terribacillus saccharophilus TaxID=361277 RepID=A0ABX4GYK9_9BACI|nr:class I SAM-dependent rRNA methyltransferase [Terribacillus saccharophilus]PAD35746.1 RlmI/RlmK family 23S rRNA methyltransferase [Terribacillus saccharophilus]PAD96383.1 RlmI/RlmK family 23S rRNA methyltransferase [Terribacillus saccharophilus]PAD99958.1 RlmI/RlmK family 23S rRNA methyltransferase [Terribacillus saccharophilus]
MRQLVEVKVKPKSVKDIKNGYPLLTKEAIETSGVVMDEGSIIRLIDSNRKYIATAYYGIQNKGIGWVLTRKEQEKIDTKFFVKKMSEAVAKRKNLYDTEDTTAFRVFNGEGDGIGGLIIDFYDGFYMVSWYSEGIYTFREDIYQALSEVVTVRGLYEKLRFNTNGQYVEQDDYVSGEKGEFPLIVLENGMKYAVDLNDGAMTGIFLDQRNVRKALRDHYSKGKTVLNTFSYTGAFSVAAVLGGATKTTSVDVAKRSLPKTIEQFSVNEIDYEAQDIKVMDVFDYFRYAARHELKYDVVVLDPPSFARTKKITFSTAKDYPKLLKDTLKITNQGGVIIASTNNASFNMKKFKGFIDKAFTESNTRYKILEEHQLPEDFTVPHNYTEFNYLKVVFIKVMN